MKTDFDTTFLLPDINPQSPTLGQHRIPCISYYIQEYLLHLSFIDLEI